MAFQQVIIEGRVGQDAEMRYTPSGVAVANFSVAVNRKWKDGDGNEREKTTWFRVAAWRGLADFAAQYIQKGMGVLVVGEMEEPNAYMTKDNEPAANLELTARRIDVTNWHNSNSQGAQNGQAANGNAGNRQRRQYDDEDIPF
jgi:single-strand DNA-binding protein